MNTTRILCAVVLMALVTYLPRVIPLALFKNKIKNRFVQSFLMYMPYGVLAAMVFPDVFASTASFVSALIACVCALVMSYKKCGLMSVALSAVGVVFVCEYILSMLGWV
ncbi:MAG: AzlD domain-containing protein [Ruminococcaceae bacterium]|nr:AzlD domain-containing protein [Oscillospiraceae bacterium]